MTGWRRPVRSNAERPTSVLLRSTHPRWQLLGFVGAGQAVNDRDDLGDDNTHEAYGAGFRYMAVRQLGLNMGVDVSKGPEDTVWNLNFGTKF